MLNKPKYMIPSTKRQECVIDANANDIIFSCVVDGDEAIGAWEIKIYTLIDNALMFDSGKQKLSSPFFPINAKNENAEFEVNIKNFLPTSTQYFEAGTAYDDTKTYYTRKLNSDGSYSYTEYTGSKPPSSGTQLYYIGKLTNSTNAYYWTIDFWNIEGSNKSDAQFNASSIQSVFYANSTPSITIQCGVDDVDSAGNDYIKYVPLSSGAKLDSSKYYFKAVYSQSQSIGIKKYGWLIKDSDADIALVDTISHNQIYGTKDNIECSYRGFLNDGNYSVQLYIETQNGATLTTSPIPFSVSYGLTYLTNDFKVSELKQETAILLDWGQANVICGKVESGDIEYVQNYPIVDYSREEPNTSISIPTSSSVVFDYGATSGLDVPESSYMIISTQLSDASDRLIFSAEGTDSDKNNIARKLSFKSGYFVYEITDENGVLKIYRSPQAFSPNQYKWYIIIMYPYRNGGSATMMSVTESNLKDGVYPRRSLYPYETLYPSFGVWDKLKSGGV